PVELRLQLELDAPLLDASDEAVLSERGLGATGPAARIVEEAGPVAEVLIEVALRLGLLDRRRAQAQGAEVLVGSGRDRRARGPRRDRPAGHVDRRDRRRALLRAPREGDRDHDSTAHPAAS